MNIALNEIPIEFGKSVYAGSFDYVVCEALAKVTPADLVTPQVVKLDMRDVTGIDIFSTQMLLVFVVACRKKNWLPILLLPRSKRVRDFWRAWNFPQVFKEVTGTAFTRLVVKEDRHLLNEEQSTFDLSKFTKLHHHKRKHNSFRSNNFFGFFSEKINESSSSILADREKQDWKKQEVRARIYKHFGQNGDYLPSRVIFEALYNATKHSEAGVVVSSSFSTYLAPTVIANKTTKKSSYFDLFFWDDGISLYETLSSALATGMNVRELEENDCEQKYFLRCYNFGSVTPYMNGIFNHDIGLSDTMPEELILLSTFFPGTTSKPYSEHISDFDKSDPLARRGMGLYILLNAVVDILGGTVSFRTGQYFVNIRAPMKKQFTEFEENSSSEDFCNKDYKSIKITKMPDYLPKFIGNMVTIRVRGVDKA